MKVTKATVGKKTMKAILLTTIFLVVCSIAHGGIALKVNGSDPAVSPLELTQPQSIEITLLDSEPNNTSYDLTLTATGGEFSYDGSTSSSMAIQVSDLESIGSIAFQFVDDPGLAVISLTTNQSLTIGSEVVPADTEVYQLILFDMQEDNKVVVFGVNYQSLSYVSVEEEPAAQLFQIESLEMMELDGGSMMMSMSYEQPEPVWFDSQAECPDLDGDNFVNYSDFTIFASNWLQTGSSLAGDFDTDGVVDVNDLIYFSEYWLTPVYYPTYYADPLPYTTSFEDYQGYIDFWIYYPDLIIGLDYQMGWQVEEGFALVEGWWAEIWEDAYLWYQYMVEDPNSVITKQFSDTGSDHQYIYLNFLPAKDQKINILNDSDVIASVWFNAEDSRIYVLDNGNYVNTNVDYESVRSLCEYYYWYSAYYEGTFTNLTFKMNWHSNTYEVYWNNEPNDIANQAAFDQNYDVLTAFQSQTGPYWAAFDSVAIGDWTADRPYVWIDSPCACDTDSELQGRIKITGTAEGNHFGWYELYYCPSELAFDSHGSIIFENWQLLDVGTKIVKNDVLGYWDTSSIPNGYYHLGFIVYDDIGFPQGWPREFSLVTKTLSIGGQIVYDDKPAYYPVVGDLKCNTFYHEEEPEISVPWAGTFPFEFKRIYNNNRRFFTQPLAPGWSHNSQIILTENCRYNWEKRDSGPFLVPAWDDNMLAFGYIWLQYPDGSRQLFRNPNPTYDGSTVIYRPWPDDTGEYIERTSYTDGFLTIKGIYYTYHNREGIRMNFHAPNLNIPWGGGYGSIGWEVHTGINSMSDRFGNALTYNWRNVDGKPVGVSSISDGNRQIVFTFDNYNYYSKVELKAGSTVYRTIEFGFENLGGGWLNYEVTQKGCGVDEQGIYGVKQYGKKYQYQYDNGWNLLKIINVKNASENQTLIEVDYDNYKRIGKRRDYIEANNFLETSFSYSFFDPNIPGITDDYLLTIQSTPERRIIDLQNDKGAILSEHTIALDGAAVTNTTLVYADSNNPLKPTEVDSFFDGLRRQTWNNYNYFGDLLQQRVYVDDSNYIATEMTYHPDYAFETSQTSWQDLNETGKQVQKLTVYGNADGTENEHGKYLVAEKVLLDDGGSEDPNNYTWAVTSYKYHANGLLREITDSEGFITLIEYDDNGYKTYVRKGTDPNTAEIAERYQYDAIGQLMLQANPLGGVVRHSYDGFGRLWRTQKYEDLAVMYRSDPNSYAPPIIAESLFGYNEQGFKTYEKLETGGQVETSYTYNGLPKQKTFDDGSIIEFSYDQRGNKTQEYRYEAASQQDWYITFGYDSMDRLTETNWFDYDDTTLTKRQISEYYGTGKKKTEQFYGYAGNPEKTVGNEFDILTRLIRTTIDPGGLSLTTRYTHDAAGNRICITDPKGSLIYADYDNANRRIREYFATEEQEAAVPAKEIGYYNNGKVLSETNFDYDGSTVLAYSEFGYDARGRTIQTIQQIDSQNDAVTDYYYFDAVADPNDPNTPGILASIIIEDAEEKQTVITLDGFGRQLKRLYPSNDFEEYLYNADGTLLQKAVWDDQSIKQWMDYGYDGYGRVTDVNYPDSGYVTFIYDGFGRKTIVIDGRNPADNIGGNHQISYVHDVLGRISSYTDQNGYRVSYSYQHDGQKQAIAVDRSGSATAIYNVEYGFDAANRTEYVRDGLSDFFTSYIAQFSYDANGNRNSLNYYLNGSAFGGPVVNMSYAYNLDNCLTGYGTTGGPDFTLSASQNGSIDGLGRLVNASETIGAASHSLSYSYDSTGQLKTWQMDAVQHNYSYDKAGNVQNMTVGQNATNYGYTGDLMTSAGTSGLNWDDNGRLKTSLTASLVYNWDGKLRSATSGSNSLSCKYDPDGNRIYKNSTADGSQKYIVDIAGELPVVLLAVNNDPNVQMGDYAFYYANAQILAQHAHTNPADPNFYVTYFYLHDRLGSVRAVINTSGSIVNSYTYEPFGKNYAVSETVYNPFGFTGQWYDSEIGQYYLRARQYEPTLMRFTDKDLQFGERELPLTIHKYLYCLNDPVNNIDPSGEIYMNVANALQAATTVYSAGLLIAAYGTDKQNFELIVAGGFIMQLTPLAYGLGLGFGDKVVTVTRWGDPGTGPGWVMGGGKNPLNYLLSGKWQPGMGNQFAAYGTGHSWQVMASELGFPSGWKWVFGFFGQLVLK